MKTKNVIIYSVIGFLIIFIPSIIFVLSNLSFISGSFITSKKINNFLERYFDSDFLILKDGDYYYRIGEYDKARINYQKIECKTDEMCFIIYNNLGNTYYRIGELSGLNEQVSFWQTALNNYSKALNIKEDKETRFNYEFVSKKLQESIQKINDQKHENLDQDILKRGEDLKNKVNNIFNGL